MATNRTPLILIHGMNGFPEHWKQSKFYDNLLAQGYPSERIHLLSWSDNRRMYGNTGDMTPVVDRLARVVDQLCSSFAVPAVDIATYSAGGLIARAYLSRREEARQAHRIRKLVMIAVPNNGSYWMLPDHNIELNKRVQLAFQHASPSGLLNPVYALLAQTLSRLLVGWMQATLQPVLENSLGCVLGFVPLRSQLQTQAARQMQPQSDFMLEINRAIPHDLQYCVIYGDIRILFQGIALAGIEMKPVEIELGDLVVDVASARGQGLFQATEFGYKVVLGDGKPNRQGSLAKAESVVALAAQILKRVAPPHNHGLLFVETAAQQAAIGFLLQ